MSAAIQQAAISYFGLPDGTQMVEGGPMGHFAFTVPLTEEHLRGIADRMKALSETAEERPRIVLTDLPTQDELRGIWNAMPAKEQGIYGSFGVFARRATTDMLGVWIPLGECNHAQQAADPPAKRDQEEYFLLINPDMLTEEQRIKYAGGAS